MAAMVAEAAVTVAEVDLREAIEHRAIYRCSPGERLPAKGSPPYVWQFYLRRVLLDAEFARAAGQALWARMREGSPLQLAACETAGVPLACAVQRAALDDGVAVNLVAIRRTRKAYGLRNLLEGQLDAQPALIVDDLAASGSTAARARAVLESAGCAVLPGVLALVSKTGLPGFPQRGPSVHLFDLKDFALRWDDYVAAYGYQPNFGRVV